ncbi:MAG: SUMF1/EgtB/PvdO family nonheme iron enzyme [Chloroflexi bacterium]|nr:SUMF1/EgtB/PvdO family nonheme iron enzyme [Chloroflexota bacterium]
MLPAVCEIPAGQYTLGAEALPFSRPPHPVTLAAFALAAWAVTNGEFAPFIAAEGYQDARFWSEMGWRWQKSKGETQPAFWEDTRFNHTLQPVVGVCWYEADAFARWLALESGQAWRLPSEAEWEAAARWQQPLPAWPPSESVDAQINSVERGIGRTWAAHTVGQRAACGAWNLLGNVWEWTSTRWGHNWQTLDYPYPYRADDGREDLSGSHARVIRGGSYFDLLREAHPAQRARFLPGSRASNIGFRLAFSQRDAG